MGTCQVSCKKFEYQADSEVKLQEKHNISQQNYLGILNDGSKMHVSSHSQLESTHKEQLKSTQQQISIPQTFTDPIAGENSLDDCIKLPKFIENKQLHSSIIPRKNRFLEDIEYQVKIRIHEIQLEEKIAQQELIDRQRKAALEKQEKLKVQQLLIVQTLTQTSHSQSAETHSNKKIQQSFISQENSQQQSFSFQQFTPINEDYPQITIKDQSPLNNSPISQAANQSKALQTNFKATKQIQKQALDSNRNSSEDHSKNSRSNQSQLPEGSQDKSMRGNFDNSMVASMGSMKSQHSLKQNNKKPTKAMEKILSSFYTEHQENEGKTFGYQKKQLSSYQKKKGILKYKTLQVRHILMRSQSQKTNKTSNSRKKVRFSQDTNFNNERKEQRQLVSQKSWYQFW